jgi:nitric oxide reductase NorD protein
MLASALAGRPVAVAELPPGESSWTDGHTIYVDASTRPRTKLEALKAIAVHASMIAAGSLDFEVVRRLVRHPRLARRYLAIEAHRALVANGDVLPSLVSTMGNRDIASRSDSPGASLRIAEGPEAIDDPPPAFGVIRAGQGAGRGFPSGRTNGAGGAATCPARPSKPGPYAATGRA